MSEEGQLLEKKSLRLVMGKTTDWQELAKDCVAFANATGGNLLLGIEDGEDMPPAGQQIPPDLPDKLRRRISECTVNVDVWPDIRTSSNGGQYINLHVRRSSTTSSTTDGRFYLRVGDQSKPVTGDGVMRLVTERGTKPWETQTVLQIPEGEIDLGKLHNLINALRVSDRVKNSVKEKSNDELLSHYQLVRDAWLTHLGILCLGKQSQRAQLATAPVIQFIKYDEQGRKVNKLIWDDHALNPMELVEAVWQEIPDFREHYELPDGLYRQNVPAFDEVVIRELLVNALVHRPYTVRGQRAMWLALGTVVRSITIRVGKLFKITLDRAGKAV